MGPDSPVTLDSSLHRHLTSIYSLLVQQEGYVVLGYGATAGSKVLDRDSLMESAQQYPPTSPSLFLCHTPEIPFSIPSIPPLKLIILYASG